MWIIITSVCSFVILISITMLCLCWRKKTQKNDLLGLDGLVTQKNPDENVNHLPSAIAQSVPDGIIHSAGETAKDAIKRPVVVNNPKRSLPDIPSDGVRSDGDIVTYEPNGDNSSDLYATVEPYQNTAKRHTLPNGIDSRPSISQHSSISQADDTFSPYARVREHPYDKLRKTEHPYARVQPSSSQEQEENSSGEATPRTATLRNERLSTSQALGEPTAPSRSRRSSGQSGVGIDIPAASAVAGGIAANQELPYMTPPITQPNFSGDSQDSSKGYTSISVREPLANIRAQTKVLSKGQGDLDPHYSTVSDDSDDMYTTIQDPNNAVYTSGSETYAQIQPPQLTIAAEINPDVASSEASHEEEEELCDQLYEPAPQPPSVDSLKHVTHTHSRQASSSSSVGNLGSPKPEKRQANSPLPPPPPVAASPDLLSVDTLPTCKNLDDMYAKVQKGRKKNDKDEPDLVKTSIIKENENLQRKSTSSSGSEERKQSNDIVVDPSVSEHSSFPEHNYETLRKSPRKGSDPGYEKLKPRDSESMSEPGYDTINGPDSILSTDPGYEVLKHQSEAMSDVDPNYEELRHRASSISDSAGYTTIGNKLSVYNNVENNGYSVVNKQSKHNSSSEEVKSKNSSSYESDPRDLSMDEPNYESMPSESLSEHNYAVLKSTGSESDPNYESVSHSDPNYESVKYLDVSLEEPPYERLQDEDSSKTDSNQSGCEKVQTEASGCEKNSLELEKPSINENLECCSNNTDPDYETIKNEKLTSDGTDTSIQLESDYDGIVQV